MAYSDNFPATRPVFMADFANGGKIDPRATFSRASTGTFFGTDKVLSSENLLPYSENSGLWSQSGLLSRTGSQTDPAGGSTGFTLRENSSAGFHRIYQNVTATGDLAFTVYAKQNSGTRYLTLTLSNANNDWVGATFDLAGGAAATSSGSSSSYSSLSATQAASGSSYYKCTIKATGSITGVVASLSDSTSAPSGTYGLPSYTGDGSSSIDVSFSSLSTTGATDYSFTNGQIARSYQTKLQTAASGAARFEHSATDGQSAGTSLGILIEQQSTNLVTRSSEIDHSYWSKGALNIDANAAISVDGTLTADLLRPTTASGTHYALAPVTTTASSTYTASAYVKAAGYSKIQLYFYQSTSPYTTEASSVFTLSGSGSATAAVGSSTITAVGGGYYRISVTGVAGSSGSNIQIRPVNDAGTDNFAGDGYSGIICTGVQFELGSHASSFIGTSGSTATRAADSLSVATADIPGFSEGVGTIVCETGGVASATDGNQLAFGLNGPASSNQFSAGVNAGGMSDSTVRVYSQTPAGDQAFLNPGTATVGTGYKLACRYELDNIAASMNGGTVVSDTSGQVPVGIDTLWIGELEGSYQINSNIKRIAVYNEALSDTNLQALTS